MLSVIHAHEGMLFAMWAVLIVVGLQVIGSLVTQFRKKTNWDSIVETIARPMVFSILPLLILSWLTAIDPTGILIRIWYYVAAVAIIIRALISLGKFVRK